MPQGRPGRGSRADCTVPPSPCRAGRVPLSSSIPNTGEKKGGREGEGGRERERGRKGGREERER